MRTRWVLLSTVAVFGLGWSADRCFSQDKADAAGPTPEQVNAFIESMTPGEPHKKLAAQAGEYVVKGRTWMDAKARPAEFTAAASLKSIIGGRYQVQELKGDSMGMPFEGTGLAGYDNVSKEWFSTWVDNMRTGIVHYRGHADDTGVVTMTCEMADPMNPAVKCTFRQVMTFTGKDGFSVETWRKDANHPAEFKAVEMTYTRKK
jgi:hypothetical protein